MNSTPPAPAGDVAGQRVELVVAERRRQHVAQPLQRTGPTSRGCWRSGTGRDARRAPCRIWRMASVFLLRDVARDPRRGRQRHVRRQVVDRARAERGACAGRAGRSPPGRRRAARATRPPSARTGAITLIVGRSGGSRVASAPAYCEQHGVVARRPTRSRLSVSHEPSSRRGDAAATPVKRMAGSRRAPAASGCGPTRRAAWPRATAGDRAGRCRRARVRRRCGAPRWRWPSGRSPASQPPMCARAWGATARVHPQQARADGHAVLVDRHGRRPLAGQADGLDARRVERARRHGAPRRRRRRSSTTPRRPGWRRRRA